MLLKNAKLVEGPEETIDFSKESSVIEYTVMLQHIQLI